MSRKLVILTEGHTDPQTAKTASCLIRYRPNEVVALLDRSQQGTTTQDLLGVGGAIPVVGSLDEAAARIPCCSGSRLPAARSPRLGGP